MSELKFGVVGALVHFWCFVLLFVKSLFSFRNLPLWLPSWQWFCKLYHLVLIIFSLIVASGTLSVRFSSLSRFVLLRSWLIVSLRYGFVSLKIRLRYLLWLIRNLQRLVAAHRSAARLLGSWDEWSGTGVHFSDILFVLIKV